MRGEEELLPLAEAQHGVVGTWQARELGIGREAVYRLLATTGWIRRSRHVLARTGAPRTDRQMLMAATLDAGPGAAVAGTSAAWLWGAPGFGASPAHVVRSAGASRRPSALATVHEVHDLLPAQLKVLDAIPVISPCRVVCELAGTHPHRAERVLDRFWSERLLDGRTFRRTVEELRDRGRRGSTLFRELDAARGPEYVPPASGLERRFLELCPWPMARQVDLGDDEWCGRVDFKDLLLPLVVEVQSVRYHAALVDRSADAVRRARLERAGITVVEVWDTEVWHDAHAVVERVRQARWDVQRRRAA